MQGKVHDGGGAYAAPHQHCWLSNLQFIPVLLDQARATLASQNDIGVTALAAMLQKQLASIMWSCLYLIP